MNLATQVPPAPGQRFPQPKSTKCFKLDSRWLKMTKWVFMGKWNYESNIYQICNILVNI